MEMMIQRFQKCGIYRLPTAVHCPVLQAAVSDEGAATGCAGCQHQLWPLQHCSTAAISSVSILSWSVTDGWLQFTTTVTASLHTSADYYQDYKQIVITAEEEEAGHQGGSTQTRPRHQPHYHPRQPSLSSADIPHKKNLFVTSMPSPSYFTCSCKCS